MLKWVLITIAVLIVGLILLIGGGIWWAVTSVKATPEFYDQVEVVELSEEEKEETLREVQDLALTVAPQLMEGSDDESDADADGESATESEEPSSPDTRSVVIDLTEAQVNAYVVAFVEEAMTNGNAPFSDPRVQLADGKAKLGFRIKTPEYSGVVGVDIEPQMDSEKAVTILLRGLSLGKLPIPVGQMMAQANVNTSDLPEGVSIPSNVSPPRVVLSWDHVPSATTEIESIAISDGRLQVALRVPETSPSADEAVIPSGSRSGGQPTAGEIDTVPGSLAP